MKIFGYTIVPAEDLEKHLAEGREQRKIAAETEERLIGEIRELKESCTKGILAQAVLAEQLGKLKEKAEACARTIPVQMPAPLPADEITQILGGIREENPLWRVVMHFLAIDIVTATEGVSQPKNRDEREHISGGLAWALDFRDKLKSELARAQRVAGKTKA